MSKPSLRYVGYCGIGETEMVGIFEIQEDTISSMVRISVEERCPIRVAFDHGEFTCVDYQPQWGPDLEWPEPYDKAEHLRRVELWAQENFSRWIVDMIDQGILKPVVEPDGWPTAGMEINPKYIVN